MEKIKETMSLEQMVEKMIRSIRNHAQWEENDEKKHMWKKKGLEKAGTLIKETFNRYKEINNIK